MFGCGTKLLINVKVEEILVDTEEAIVAFVKTEEELREVVASEADGLIVIDGRLEIFSGEPLVLFEGQCLTGNKRVGREGLSELVFHHQKRFNILKMSNEAGISDLDIFVEFDGFQTNDALIEVKNSQEVSLRDVRIIPENHAGRRLENVSLIYLDNDALLECEGVVYIETGGDGVKGFEIANHSRLNIRGSVDFISDGKECYVLWLYNGATVNLFSRANLRADYPEGRLTGSGGIFNSDSSVNIFGGSSVYLAGDKIMVNEFDTMGGFFIYKNAEISIRGLFSRQADTWKCTRFWRQQEASGIRSLDAFASEFVKVEKSDMPEGIKKAL